MASTVLRVLALGLTLSLGAISPALAAPAPAHADASVTPTPTLTTSASMSLTTTATTPTHCDAQWCGEGGTSWCLYWAGITGWNPTVGPLPGETAVSVGTCSYNSDPASVTAATSAASTASTA